MKSIIKKSIADIIYYLFVVGFILCLSIPAKAEGPGTDEDPFLVATAEHLDNVCDHLGSDVVQTVDIDLLVAADGVDSEFYGQSLPPPVGGVEIFWGARYQRGPEGGAIPVRNRFELLVVAAEEIVLESVRFRSPGGVWYDSEYHGTWWEFYVVAPTLEELMDVFTAGDYLIEATPVGGAPFQTVIHVPEELVHPASVPEVISPTYGQSGFGGGSTTLEISWQGVLDPEFDLIAIGVEELSREEKHHVRMQSDATVGVLDDVNLNRAWEGWVIFGNLHEAETDEGVEVFMARFNESGLLFDTHADPDFDLLESLTVGSGRAGDLVESVFMVEFVAPVRPESGDPLIARATLWTPLTDWVLFDASWPRDHSQRLEYRGSEMDPLGRFERGWYGLEIVFLDGSSAVTSVWFGQPGEERFLEAPEVIPLFVEPTPVEGSVTESPVLFAWETLSGDPAVTAVYVEIVPAVPFGKRVLEDLLPADATSYGPVELEAGGYLANVVAAHYYGQGTPGGGPVNLDGVSYDVFRYTRSMRSFGIAIAETSTGIPFSWLQGYGLPTDGSIDHEDLLGKGMTVLQDFIAGTDPTDARSLFRVVALELGPAVIVTFEPNLPERAYSLQRSGDLLDWAFASGQIGIPGGESLVDWIPTAEARSFYRVIVEKP